MIIKILQNQTSFSGIDYSERKNEQGKSELLFAENFGLVSEDMNKQSYIKYLTMIGNLNDRVKNKQFHAVVSTKGQKHSFEELAEISKKYMKEMGYQNNPYLVYGHSDTENNHVHIVSSRVDKNGSRIDPSFERIRTRDFIKKELEINLGKSAKEVADFSMRYSFATIAQLTMLIENENYITKEKNGGVDLIKDGKVQEHISKSLIQSKILNYQLDKKLSGQQKAIFSKYSEGRYIEEFQSIMKEKFGTEIILHYSKKNQTSEKHNVPYGYSVIDHKSKSVSKGSSVLPLKELLNAKDKPLHKQAIYDLMENRFNGESFSQLKNRLERYGYNLKSNGNIEDVKTENKITKLDDYFLKRSKYHDRRNSANNFTITLNTSKAILAQLFFIKPKDVNENNYALSLEEKNRYKDLLAIAVNVGPIDTRLNNDSFQIVQVGKDAFLIDHERKVIVNTEKDLGLSVDEGKIKINLPEKYSSDTELDKDYKQVPANEFIANMASTIEDGADEAKKRKRINRFR